MTTDKSCFLPDLSVVFHLSRRRLYGFVYVLFFSPGTRIFPELRILDGFIYVLFILSQYAVFFYNSTLQLSEKNIVCCSIFSNMLIVQATQCSNCIPNQKARNHIKITAIPIETYPAREGSVEIPSAGTSELLTLRTPSKSFANAFLS